MSDYTKTYFTALDALKEIIHVEGWGDDDVENRERAEYELGKFTPILEKLPRGKWHLYFSETEVNYEKYKEIDDKIEQLYEQGKEIETGKWEQENCYMGYTIYDLKEGKFISIWSGDSGNCYPTIYIWKE